MAKTIILKGDPIRKEAIASEALTPGELLAWSSGKLIPHGTSGGNAEKMVCVEEEFVGDGIDTDYAADEQVQYVIPRRGDELNMWLANGANVAKGAALESDGAGALKAHTPLSVVESGSDTKTVYTQAIVGYALEAINNTSGARCRIKVEAA